MIQRNHSTAVVVNLATSAMVLLFSQVAWAQDDGLRRCRVLTEAPARLACYDALPLTAAPTSSVPRTPTAKTTETPVGTASSDAQRDFGKPVAQTPEATYLESQVAGSFDGWEPNQLINLANGQVWRIVDGSRAYMAARSQPKVRIEQGAFGAYYLSVEGLTQAPRVRRVN